MTPYLWQSPAGKNEWTANGKKANSGNKSFTVELTGQNRTKAFDYAVTYNEDSKPNQTYFDDLAKTKDTVCEAAKSENINKGYAFAITLEADNVPDSTGTSESFSESFSWKIWDYSERAVGPDSDYVLSIFNNDYSTVTETDDGWRKIADISKDGTVSINNIADYNVDIVINPDKSTAREIFNMLKYPFAVDITSFARGKAISIVIKVPEDSLISGKTIAEFTFDNTELRETKLKSEIIHVYFFD